MQPEVSSAPLPAQLEGQSDMPITGDFDTDGNTLHFLISKWILKYENKNMKVEICFENLLEFWDAFIYSEKMSIKSFLN